MTTYGRSGPGVTPAQGRVLFHMERIFRSAGGPGVLAHQTYVTACKVRGLPAMVDTWTPGQCALGLQMIEAAARKHKMHLFRDVRTVFTTAGHSLHSAT